MWGNPLLKFETDRIPTAWWLRPVNNAARVGEHRGVTWKFVNRRPSAAKESILGVDSVDPKHPRCENPMSSNKMMMMLGAASPGWG